MPRSAELPLPLGCSPTSPPPPTLAGMPPTLANDLHPRRAGAPPSQSCPAAAASFSLPYSRQPSYVGSGAVSPTTVPRLHPPRCAPPRPSICRPTPPSRSPRARIHLMPRLAPPYLRRHGRSTSLTSTPTAIRCAINHHGAAPNARRAIRCSASGRPAAHLTTPFRAGDPAKYLHPSIPAVHRHPWPSYSAITASTSHLCSPSLRSFGRPPPPHISAPHIHPFGTDGVQLRPELPPAAPLHPAWPSAMPPPVTPDVTVEPHLAPLRQTATSHHFPASKTTVSTPAYLRASTNTDRHSPSSHPPFRSILFPRRKHRRSPCRRPLPTPPLVSLLVGDG